MTLRLRVALWLQAAALASPITLMGYWSIEPLVTHPVCPVEACNHIAPSFLLPSVLLFAAPLGLVISYAVKRGALRGGDLPWLIGVDVYALALGVLGLFLLPVPPYNVMATILVMTTFAAAVLELVWWRVKPDDVYTS